MNKILLTTIFAAASIMGAAAQTTSTNSAQDADKSVIVTSDWHLSDARSMDPSCYYAWTDDNYPRIVHFLRNLTDKKDSWDALVLNGDIFEFWRTPVDKLMVADAEGNVITDVQYLLKIKENYPAVFDLLEGLRKDGKEIVYLPGNHDLTVSEDDINGAFPGLFTCCFDTKGTGIYEPFGETSSIAIEHGNRYEYFNAPYQHGEFGTEGVSKDALLPPGYFTSKLGASATVAKPSTRREMARIYGTIDDKEETDAINRSRIAGVWNAIHAGVGSPSFEVKMMIDGIGTADKSTCIWSDYAVSETNPTTLFKDSWTVDNWKKRCELNKVPLPLSFATGIASAFVHETFDDLAFQQRLFNPALPTLICVFGHSHSKLLQTRHDDVKGDVVYLNDGAWVDGKNSYGIIRYSSARKLYTIELREVGAEGGDTMIDCRYLYVPEGNANRLADGSLQFCAKAKLVDADATDIREVTPPTSDACYTLTGQRVASPVRGINIINGKKVLRR